jgi:hypothetical protein
VTFRQRLLETLRGIETVLTVDGVMVIGSEVPNPLEPGAAATLVVSQDVDIAVPVARLAEVKRRLARLDARGVWVRLARLLAGSAAVWAIPCEAVAELETEGFSRTAVGAELDPPRTMLIVPAERVAHLAGARQLEVRVSAELLATPSIALVPFDELPPATSGC